MKNISINKNLQGEKLKKLLLFVSKISNKMSFSRDYNDNLTTEEFDKIQAEHKSFILEQNKKMRLDYSTNINGYRDSINKFYNTEKKAEKYFNDLLEQNLMIHDLLKYENFQNKKTKNNYTKISDCIDVKYTRITPVTVGGVFEICYFELSDTFKNILSKMDNLFNYRHYIKENSFDDFTFYDNDRIILAICSHENFAYMNLENDEYQELLKLNILDDIV